ncbi:hypothetical protein [Bifidobacterium sp. SO1]|uniref:hypothetical protein n=1 Tax=Bifidobacterium sp. SO1 TaxID=2809029 RepID=UPI001BDD217E|nr:hypothetical protein [Bifidobacterium sp. SO1]MBT1161257.1 hypothetical protein [Bifidobacterium sp. SO1]
MTSRGDDRKIRRWLERKGYTVELANSSHWKITRDGRLVTTTSLTPSDRNSYKNLLHDIRRYECSE